MIIFLSGKDSFRSREKLLAIKEKYLEKTGNDTNLVDLEAANLDFANLFSNLTSTPFLANKRLVIIRNIFANQPVSEKMAKNLSQIPETTIVVFYESSEPDKKNPLHSALIKKAKSQEFDLLDGYKLKQWLAKTVENQGGKIDSGTADKLIFSVGNDLWRLAGEVSKLICYDKQITPESIALLVKPKIEAKIFDLVDAVGQKNGSRAIFLARILEEKGEDPLYLLSMINYQFRNLLLVKDFIDINPQYSPQTISHKLNLHPYVVGKSLRQANNFSLSQLKDIYHRLQDFDFNIKTGKIKSSLAIEILIAELCIS